MPEDEDLVDSVDNGANKTTITRESLSHSGNRPPVKTVVTTNAMSPPLVKIFLMKVERLIKMTMMIPVLPTSVTST